MNPLFGHLLKPRQMTFDRLLRVGWHRVGRDDIDRYLQRGGDVNRRTESGSSLLHLATDNARIDLIRQLVARGADINATGHRGYTSLHLAVNTDCDTQSRDGRRATQLPVSAALVQLGADEAIRDGDGHTPRDIAVAYGPGEAELYDALPRPRRGPPPGAGQRAND
jgi:ankyrin repeat protein